MSNYNLNRGGWNHFWSEHHWDTIVISTKSQRSTVLSRSQTRRLDFRHVGHYLQTFGDPITSRSHLRRSLFEQGHHWDSLSNCRKYKLHDKPSHDNVVIKAAKHCLTDTVVFVWLHCMNVEVVSQCILHSILQPNKSRVISAINLQNLGVNLQRNRTVTSTSVCIDFYSPLEYHFVIVA